MDFKFAQIFQSPPTFPNLSQDYLTYNLLSNVTLYTLNAIQIIYLIAARIIFFIIVKKLNLRFT